MIETYFLGVQNLEFSCFLTKKFMFSNLIFMFLVDASKAGRGNIEIMVDDGSITCEVQNHGNNRFTASYKPTAVEEHLVKMNFNGIPVNGKTTGH